MSNGVYNARDNTYEYDTLAPYKTPPETKIKNHIVVINSIDRNWYGYTKLVADAYVQ
jgi:hypothetical protein